MVDDGEGSGIVLLEAADAIDEKDAEIERLKQERDAMTAAIQDARSALANSFSGPWSRLEIADTILRDAQTAKETGQ